VKAILSRPYSFLEGIDLKTATPTMYAEAFRNFAGGQEAVLKKSRAFYLHAAKFAGIEIGQRITAGSSAGGPRTKTASPKPTVTRKPVATKKSSTNGAAEHSTKKNSGRSSPAMMEKLLQKFPVFDPNWSDDLKSKWFAGFEQFMNRVGKEGGQ